MSEKNPDGLLALALVPVRDVLVKIAKLLEKILEKLDQIAQRLGVPAVPPPVPAPPVIVEIAKANRYDVAEIDLGTAHTDEPIGLKPLGIVASALTWEEVEAPLTFKLNSKGNKPLKAAVGVEHEDWEIEEIYITNAAAAAGKKAVLYYEWRE